MKTNYQEIIKIISDLDIKNYHQNRNYADGSITKISPYISRGIISTKFVLESLKERTDNLTLIGKFLQELAWRDYWQIVWQKKNINVDLKHVQKNVVNFGVPENILNRSTGINVIDKALDDLFSFGYIHNHLRMYIASIVCNIGKCHWHIPAKWFYYHLIDGDWGSNALSWQWVCGTNSSKKYIANQENINKFFYDKQKNTFLDKSYNYLSNCKIPNILENVKTPNLKTEIPHVNCKPIDKKKPILIYNYYNIDPLWRKNLNANRVLLLEPSIFEEYPISDKVFKKFLKLSKNIPGLKIIKSEFGSFAKDYSDSKIYYKEHPFNTHYKGICDQRDWMFKNHSFYPSFYKFWNASKNEIGL